MAYGAKYRAEYSNKNGDTITIELQKINYTGAVTAIDQIKDPAKISYRPQDGEQIIGSQLSFSFVTKNRALFDDLLTSNYKDYKVVFSVNLVAKWRGWLMLDDIATSYLEYVHSFSLAAMDELGELGEYTISNDSGGQISGNNTLLWYIKNGLKFNDLPLDFSIILNTKETALIGLDENALFKCELPSDRWINVKSGKKEIDSAKKVISEILKIFNAVLYQDAGKYWIVNNQEVGTKIYNHSFSTLALQSTGTRTAAANLNLKNFDRSSELTKKRPLKTASVTFENKYIPSNLITVNPDFSTTDLTFWNRIAAGSNSGQMTITENELQVSGTDSATLGDASGTTIFTDPIAIERKEATDKITVQFDYYLKNITFASAGNTAAPYLDITLVYKEDETKNQTVNANVLGSGKATFLKSFDNVGSGNYVIKIIDRPNGSAKYTLIEYRLDNVSALAVTKDGTSSITTYDRFYTATNTASTAIDGTKDDTILAGDGLQINDIGNLRVGATLTKEWNTAGGTEALSLQYIYLLQKLKLNQKFRNKLRVRLIASDFQQIAFNSHVEFDGVLYIQNNYTITYGPIYTAYDLELIELPTAAITFVKSLVPLRSVNGEKPANELSIEETDPTVPDHVKGITGAQITAWDAKPDTLQEVTGKGNVTTNSLILKNGTKQFELKIDIDGHLIFSGGANQNVRSSGDFNAFGTDAAPVNWWDNMPIATATVLGGVKIGSNLTITAEGVLSADADPYTLPTASATVLGGVKVGNNLSILNGVLSASFDGSAYVEKAGDTMSGSLTVNSYVKSIVGANNWALYADSNGLNNSGLWFNGANDGDLVLRRSDGTIGTRIDASGVNSFINGHNIWTAGNLDPVITSNTNQAIDPNTLKNQSLYRIDPHVNNPTNEHYSFVTYGNAGNVTGQLATHYVNGQTYVRAFNTVWSAWRQLWDSGNLVQGSGNGFDADTVDSLHASSFWRRDAANAYDVRISGGDGTGVRFYDDTRFKIYLSIESNLTYGGSLVASDYNMYFEVGGGTNRGFVFKNAGTPIAQIESTGAAHFKGAIKSAGDVIAYAT